MTPEARAAYRGSLYAEQLHEYLFFSVSVPISVQRNATLQQAIGEVEQVGSTTLLEISPGRIAGSGRRKLIGLCLLVRFVRWALDTPFPFF
jgi:hypothetical protein